LERKTINPTKMIEVSCAIIQEGDKILAVKRAHGMHLAGKWEFPGGKTEPGETAETCIIREIFEELEINIKPILQLKPVTYHYPEKSIRLIPFRCKILSGKIKLAEHEDYKWVSKTEIELMDWAAADIEIIELNQLKD